MNKKHFQTSFLFFLLLNFSNVLADSTSIDDANQRFIDEQRINDTLSTQSADENNQERAKYYEQSSATGGGSSAGKPNLDNLTDADRQTVNNYVHQEYIQEAMNEECNVDDDTQKACQGQDVGNGMVQALAQAYGMIVGMGGLGGDLKMRESGGDKSSTTGDGTNTDADTSGAETTAENGENSPKKDKKRHDYCKYVAIVTEAVSMFQQTQAQNALVDGEQSSADTAQKAALYKAARSHQERAKTAKIQFAGWGVTAGCYTAMLATGAALDWQLGVKLGGSALLTYFFKQEMDKHQDAYEKTRAIADKLPGRGDCNPVSERDCYCSMPSTQNDIRYCQSYLHDRMIAANSIRTTCVTTTMQADPKCACIATNTCFDQEFLEMTNIEGLPPTFSKTVSQPLASLTRGELTSGAVNAAGLVNSQAIRRALRDVDEKLGSKSFNPNKQQKDSIKAMLGSGLPRHVASALATSKVSKGALNKANAALGGRGGKVNIVRGKARSNGNVWGFGGNKYRKRSKKSRSNKFSKFGKKNKRQPSGKVINFAQKASARAQINQDSSRPIFEIISRRYQLSGFDRLNIK